jgi:hypothetical protein
MTGFSEHFTHSNFSKSHKDSIRQALLMSSSSYRSGAESNEVLSPRAQRKVGVWLPSEQVSLLLPSLHLHSLSEIWPLRENDFSA